MTCGCNKGQQGGGKSYRHIHTRSCKRSQSGGMWPFDDLMGSTPSQPKPKDPLYQPQPSYSSSQSSYQTPHPSYPSQSSYQTPHPSYPSQSSYQTPHPSYSPPPPGYSGGRRGRKTRRVKKSRRSNKSRKYRR